MVAAGATTELPGSGYVDGGFCFNYENCSTLYRACSNDTLHTDLRYAESSAAWVLICSIIVFFMKAGFMLLEVAFARNPKERRYVIVLKHQDAFASAFGFFLIGYDAISRYVTTSEMGFFRISDPVQWFFKFTFASNAATIIGGCLVTNRYKLRMPAAFISAFVISGIIHPLVARLIWSDHCDSLSPYRFCNYTISPIQVNRTCTWNCTTEDAKFSERLYILDFAGGGAVHLIGGMAGLVICLFAKFQDWKDKRKPYQRVGEGTGTGEPQEEMVEPDGFWDWMYPVHGGEETVSEAALGVIILWFCWFAFNCGSAESIETGFKSTPYKYSIFHAFYGIPGVIALNMILAGASGGMVAIAIAVWAQARYRTASVNANEIANGVLSALVSITAGCAFVDYWGAVFIGFFAVIFYHFGCWLEYRFGIQDTARVVPVHGMCGLWSILATGLFMIGPTAQCNLHAAFEGLCYCELRLPQLGYWERLGAQIIGAIIMILIGLTGSFIMYFVLYIIPIKPTVWLLNKVLFLSPKKPGGESPRPLVYRGGWLLTTPEEDFEVMPIPEGNYNHTVTVIGEFNSEGRSADTGGAHLHRRGNLTHRTAQSHHSNLGSNQNYGLNTPVPSMQSLNGIGTGTGTGTGTRTGTGGSINAGRHITYNIPMEDEEEEDDYES